jgi:hypothetical protein
MLMPPDLLDWVPDDHFVWSILGAVEQVDLTDFYGVYRVNDRLLESVHRLEENNQVELQANTAYEAWRAARAAGDVSGQKLGMPPKPFTPPDVPEGVMKLRELGDAGVTQRPETALADAGCWHKEQIESIVSDGIQVLVPPDGGLRKDIRPGGDRGMYSFMRRVLASDAGHALDKHRKRPSSRVPEEHHCVRSRGWRRLDTGIRELQAVPVCSPPAHREAA